MIIRPAIINDIESIKKLGISFYNEAKFIIKGLSLNIDSYGVLVEKLLGIPNTIILAINSI